MLIFSALCIAGETFLLYALFHFTRESKHTGQQESPGDVAIPSRKERSVGSPLVGRLSTAVWSEGTWRLNSNELDLPMSSRGINPRALNRRV